MAQQSSQKQAAAARAQQEGQEARLRRHRAHSTRRSTHDHHDHRPPGNALSWATSRRAGFKGSRKSTPFAAQVAAESGGPRRDRCASRISRSASRAPAPAASRRVRGAECARIKICRSPSDADPHNGAGRRSGGGSEPTD